VHSTTKPLAAIDVGANTIHLVVVRITHDGTDIDYVDDELELVRLGADVSATGAIGPERMERALVTIRNQVATANAHHVETILGIGTEGVRAATNGIEFLEKVRAETGVEIELVTGDQEAALTFWGGTSGLKPSPSPRAVLDLGGGSLELVVGVNSQVLWRTSLALGSGSMYNRYVRSDPSTTEELRAIECGVHEALSPLNPPLPVKEVIVCGGTGTTLAWLAGKVLHEVHSISRPQDGKVSANGIRRTRYLTRERLEWLRALIQACTSTELSRRYDIELGRAQLLASGIAILIATMEQLDADTLHIRKRGIREGALLAYTHVGEDWLDNARDGTGW
jgi:exopolyphosphatase / guanosine-5'-triphosphate,3'-diphosphate pyrophosphatase